MCSLCLFAANRFDFFEAFANLNGTLLLSGLHHCLSPVVKFKKKVTMYQYRNELLARTRCPATTRSPDTLTL